MVAVAVVGLMMGGIVGGVRLKRRQQYFRDRATRHKGMEYDYRRLERDSRFIANLEEDDMRWLSPERRARIKADRVISLRLVERYSGLAAYHAALARKYEYAADHPWLPVELDPPPPEPDWIFVQPH
jgi:hypothetical protein